MITLKINKYEEPKAIVSSGQSTNWNQTTFNNKEIEDAKNTATLCGLEPGLQMEHKPTGHFIVILGFKTTNPIMGYKGKPMVLKAKRTRQNHSWETEFSVEELLGNDYVVLTKGN